MEKEEQNKLRILILEDNPTDSDLIECELHKSDIPFASRRVGTRDAFIRELDEFRPDILLSDYNLPIFDGLVELDIVLRDYPNVPVIMVTSALPDTAAITLKNLGIKDYVLKDNLARLPAIVRETIEYKKSEQLKNHLVAIINMSPDFIAYADAKSYRVLFINSGGRKMCRIEENEDVTKLHVRDFHPEWSSKLLLEEALPTTIRDGIWKGECSFLNRNGQEIPVLMTTHAHKTPNGEVSILSTIARDISDRKFAEFRITRSNAELEQVRHDLELSQDKQKKTYLQIVTSEKLAGLGQLTAGVCHEILNPLNVISLHTQMLSRRKNLDNNIMVPLAKINDEIKRIVKIVNALTTFSRQREPELKKIKIEIEIENVLVLVEKDLVLDNIKVIRDFAPQLPEILVDPDQMRQVFFNIINNAHYAMRGKEGRLSVSIGEIDLQTIRIKFADTGSGIKKEVIQKLFNPFFTTKPEGQGTGLGLSVVRTIIENHRGSIYVESEEGKGTTFIINLPIEKRRPVLDNQ